MLPFLGLAITRLGLPPGLSLSAAEVRLRAATRGRTVAPDDSYAPQGGPPAPCDADRCWGRRAIGWRPAASCGAVGLIDAAVDPTAPGLAGRVLGARSFVPAGSSPADRDHGTALASLLAGGTEGLLPAAGLLVAEVFADAGGGRPLPEVARLLEEHHVKRVPVLRQGKLVGIVSRADLLRALVHEEEAVERPPRPATPFEVSRPHPAAAGA